MTKVYLNVKTKDLWNTILGVINIDEVNQYRWFGGQDAKEEARYCYWNTYKEKTVLQIDTELKQLMYGNIKYHEPLGHFIQNYDGDWLENKKRAEDKECKKEGNEMETNKKYVQVKTQSGYNLFMNGLGRRGYKWASGDSPSTKNYWNANKEETVICIIKNIKTITVSTLDLEIDNENEIVVYRGNTSLILNDEEHNLPNMDSKIEVPKVVYDYLKEKHVNEDGEPDRDDDFLIYTLTRDYSTGDLKTKNRTLYSWFGYNDSIFKLVDAIRKGYYHTEKEKEKEYYLKIDNLGYVMDYTTDSDGDKTIEFAKNLTYATKYTMKTIEQDLPDLKQYAIEVLSND